MLEMDFSIYRLHHGDAAIVRIQALLIILLLICSHFYIIQYSVNMLRKPRDVRKKDVSTGEFSVSMWDPRRPGLVDGRKDILLGGLGQIPAATAASSSSWVFDFTRSSAAGSP